MSPVDTTATETVVQAAGFRIRVRVAGSGAPVVLLPGIGGISDAPGFAAISAAFRTYAVELPGFGRSATNETSTSMRDLAAAVAAAIKELGLRHYAIVASGVAARVGLWYAIDNSAEVETLTLVSPSAILPDGVRLPTVGPEQLLHSIEMAPIGQAEREEQLLARIFGEARDSDLEQAMTALQIPTLMLFGDEDYQIPAEVGRIYRQLLPKSFYILVHRAGPLIAHERPEAFASVVADFLEYKDGFVHSHTTGVINP
jgi:pimeloyl-ACP methyl ester carboxylesterase